MGKIESIYKAKVIFEFSLAISGISYLVIFGQHINGYWCCVTNHGWGCEMTSPCDTRYNRDKLISCGATKQEAIEIANAIQEMSNEEDQNDGKD